MRRASAVAVLGLLVTSAAALAAAHLMLPGSYDVVRHTVAEAGAQNVAGAWPSRVGFGLLGVAVLVLATVVGDRWSCVARAAHAVLGTAAVLLTFFGPLAWDGRPGSTTTASWHAVLAASMVAAFVIGVVAVRAGRGSPAGGAGVLDVVAAAAVVVLALATLTMPTSAGVSERLLLVAAIVWYALEAARLARDVGGRRPGTVARP